MNFQKTAGMLAGLFALMCSDAVDAATVYLGQNLVNVNGSYNQVAVPDTQTNTNSSLASPGQSSVWTAWTNFRNALAAQSMTAFVENFNFPNASYNLPNSELSIGNYPGMSQLGVSYVETNLSTGAAVAMGGTVGGKVGNVTTPETVFGINDPTGSIELSNPNVLRYGVNPFSSTANNSFSNPDAVNDPKYLTYGVGLSNFVQQVRFTFDSAVGAFGIFISDLGDDGFTMTAKVNGSAADPLAVLLNNALGTLSTAGGVNGPLAGNLVFLGVLADADSVSNIEFSGPMGSAQFERFGLDYAVVANGRQQPPPPGPAVPEPTSLALAGLALAGISLRKRFRKTA